MQMFKRTMSLLLAFAMVLSMMPNLGTHVHAQELESESVVETTAAPTTEAPVAVTTEAPTENTTEAPEIPTTEESQEPTTEPAVPTTEGEIVVDEEEDDDAAGSQVEDESPMATYQAWIDEMLQWYLVELGGLTLPEGELSDDEWEEFRSEVEAAVAKLTTDDVWMAQVELYDLEEAMMAELTEDEINALLESNLAFILFSIEIYEEESGANLLDNISGTLSLSVTGLTVSYTGYYNTVVGSGDGTASCTGSSNSITAKAKSSKNLLGGITSSWVQITLTNTGYENAILSYTGTNTNGTVTTNGSGTQTVSLAKNESVTIKLTSSSSDQNEATLTISGITLTEVQLADVTFNAPENGTYTVTPSNGSEQSITSNVTFSNTTDVSYAVAATAATGYKFFGWLSVTTGKYLSHEAATTVMVSEDATIKPVFVLEDTAIFGVGSEQFYDLNEADAYATSSGNRTIILLADGTLYSGDYTISSGNTLLIPWDDANTAYGASAKCTSTSSYFDDSGYASWEKPTPYRTLTLAADANISVNGNIEVSGRHAAAAGKTQMYGGSPTGKLGYINMLEGSHIDLNSGAYLYAWGYIYGDGTITAKNGSSIYENFQIMDFRGGSATTALAEEYLVFPLSQYYVQNVEVATRYEYGASEYMTTSLFMSNMCNSATAKFIGDGAMFVPAEGAYFIKDYNPSTDRLEMHAYGSSALSTMDLSIGSTAVNSADFVLPITNNIEIHLHSGTTTLQQNMMMLPGSSLTIDQGATLNLAYTDVTGDVVTAGGYVLQVFDSENWTQGLADGTYETVTGLTFVHSARQFTPVAYTCTARKTRTTAADLTDVTLDINGTVVTNGYVYSTVTWADAPNEDFSIVSGGANIISSEKTGEFEMVNGAGEDMFGYMYDQDNASYYLIPLASAQLKNGNGTLVDTTSAEAGTTYNYCATHDRWYTGSCPCCAGTHGTTEVKNTKAATCGAAGYTGDTYCVECGTKINSGATIPATGNHSYGSVVTAPTCTVDGYTTYTCSVCGDSYTGDKVTANGHTYAATGYTWSDDGKYCTANGTCSTCSATTTAAGTITSKETTAATCSVMGTTTYTATFTVTWATTQTKAVQDIATISHTPNEDDGDCTTAITCSVCGTVTTAAKDAHTPETDDGDCTTAIKCSVCGTVTTAAKTAHTPEADDGDCTTAIKCSVCGTVTTAAKDAHTPEADDGDCTTAIKCSVCGTVTTEAKDAHTPEADDGDCTTAIKCSVCGTVTTEAKDAHTPEADDGDCTTAIKCSVCGTVTTEAKDAHTPEADDGDCTTAIKCSVCGTVTTEAKDAHAWNNGEQTTAPGCESQGVTTYTCTVSGCGATYTESIAANGHEDENKDHVCDNGCNVYQGTHADGDDSDHLCDYCQGDVGETCTDADNNHKCDECGATTSECVDDDTNHECDYAGCKAAMGEHKSNAAHACQAGKCDYCQADMPATAEHQPEADDGDCTTAIKCSVCGTVTTDANEDHEYTYTDNDDGTHTWNCSNCQNSGTESHDFDNDEHKCVCGKVETFAVTVTESNSKGSKYYISNYTATYGEAYTTRVLKLENSGENTAWYATVNSVTVNGQEVDYTFTLNNATLTVDAQNITGAIVIDVTVMAKLTFDLNGGALTEEYAATLASYGITVTDGKFSVPSPYGVASTQDITQYFVREGYTFDYLLNVATGAKADSTAPVENCELQAQWQCNLYRAVFNANGGYFADGSSALTVNAFYGEIPVAPADPTRAGYTFAGWNPELAAMGVDGATYTATWTENTHTVTFDGNGATSGTMEAQTIGEANAVALTGNAFAKTGYAFLGWNTDKNATVPLYADKDAITVTVDTTLYAIWDASQVNYKVETYTMGLDGNYGDAVTKTLSAEADTEITVTRDDIEGFTVDTEKSILSGTAAADGSTVLKIYYSRNQYTITYMVDGVQYGDAETCYYGETVTAKAEPTKTGYTFSGWRNVPATMPAKNVEITGSFTVNSYTITYKVDGEQYGEAETYTYGADVTAKDEPTKTGYTFSGWSEIPATMPAENVEVTGTFTVNTYTFTWTVNGEKYHEDKIAYGELVDAPTYDVPAGYTFSGWTMIPATMPAYDTGLDATLTAIEYAITYDLAGGELAEGESNPASYTIESKDITLVNPTRTGYTFTGWTGTDLTEAAETVTIATGSIGDRSYTATWQLNTYTVSLSTNSDGVEIVSVNGSTSDFTVDHGEELTVVLKNTKSATQKAVYFEHIQNGKTVYYYSKFAENNIVADETTVTLPADFVSGDVKISAYAYVKIEVTLNGGAHRRDSYLTFDVNEETGVATLVTWSRNQVSMAYEFYRDGHTVVKVLDRDNPTIEYTLGDQEDYFNGVGLDLVYDLYLTLVWKCKTLTNVPAVDATCSAEGNIEHWKCESCGKLYADENGETELDSVTIAIDEDAHSWNETPASYTGITETQHTPVYTCAHNENHTKNGDAEEHTYTDGVCACGAVATYTVSLHRYSRGVEIVSVNDSESDFTVKHGEDLTVVLKNAASDIRKDVEMNSIFIGDEEYGYRVLWYEGITVEQQEETVIITFPSWAVTGDIEIYTRALLKITVDLAGGAVTSADSEYYSVENGIATLRDSSSGYSAWIVFGRMFEKADHTLAAIVDDKGNSYSLTGYTNTTTDLALTLVWKCNTLTAVTGTPATCTKTGILDYWKCKSCGKLYADEAGTNEITDTTAPIDKTAHSWDDGVITTPAICNAEGVMTYTCEHNSDHTYTESVAINPENHGGNGVYFVDNGDGESHNGYCEGCKKILGQYLKYRHSYDETTHVCICGDVEQFTLTFKAGYQNADGTEKSVSMKLDYGANVVTVNFSREGYTFAGWLDEEGNDTTVPTTVPAENATYTAKWEAKSYTITWTIGESSWTTTAKHDEAITAPEVTKPENVYGYRWTTEIPDTATGPMTIEGVWTVSVTLKDMDGNSMSFSNGVTIKTLDQGDELNLSYRGTNYKTGYTLYLVNTADETDKHEITYSSGAAVYPTVTVTENTTYQLTAEPIKYTITWYNADGTEADTTQVAYDETPAHDAPTTPVEKGYTFTFTGWAETQDGEVLETLPTVTGDAAYYAVFAKTANTYLVDWMVKGWNEDGSDAGFVQTSVKFGEAITEPKMTWKKEGYTFSGWQNVPETMPAENITIYGEWTVNSYTLTFKAGYQNADGTEKSVSMELAYGSTVPTINFTRTGYTLTGWVDGKSNAVDFPATVPAENATYTAQWTANTYTVTWNVDGETDTTTQTYDAALVLPTEPTKTGYTFAGWFTAAEGGEQVTADTVFTNVNNDTVYYAQWTANTYQINWYANGGYMFNMTFVTSTSSNQTFGAVIQTPPYNAYVKRVGYTFTGWNTKADGTGETLTAETIMTEASNTAVIYYAQWEASTYTVTLMVDDAQYGDLLSFTYGEAVTLPTPTKAQDGCTVYTFSGWTEEIPETMPAENLTFTGGFTESKDHTEGEPVVENNVAPDCENDGSYDNVVYCTVCETELSRETVTVPELGHKPGETVIENNVDPDCDTAGSYDNVVYCTVCETELSRETVTVPELGHKPGETVIENNVDPDCENAGSYDNVVYCTVCETELSRETVTVPELGHKPGETVIENNVDPDCENAGSYDNVVYCTVCETELSRETVTVPELGHKPGETVIENNVDPDCENAGSYDNVVYCTVCETELSRETVTVPELGHKPGETVIENNVDPDCENAGSYDNVVYCTVCEDELSRDTVVVEKLGHKAGETVIENNVDPDCENTGSYDNVVYCTVCETELSRETVTVPELGHKPGETVIENNVDPDCENTGSYDNVVYCTVCETELSRETVVVERLGHNHENDPIYSDLGDGNHSVTCGDCKEIITDSEPHTFEGDEHTCICGAVETFTITWIVDGVETPVKVTFNTMPEAPEATKAADENFTYDFKSWDKEIAAATEDTTYTAIFVRTGWLITENGAQYLVKDEVQKSGWTEIGDAWYYLDPETGYRAEGVARVPYPTEAINGITYAPDKDAVDYAASAGETFIDATESWFVFGDDGKFAQNANGMTLIGTGEDEVSRKVINGQIPWHPGFVLYGPEDAPYYWYFVGDPEIGGNRPAEGDVYVSRNTTERNFVIGGIYTFDNGRLCEYDGITDMADGTKRYYEDAQLMVGNRLTAVVVDGQTKYIYVRSNGELVVNNEYWVPGNTYGIEEGIYTFDEDGFLVMPEPEILKNGVYLESGKWIYYIEGAKQYNAGLIQLPKGTNWYDADESVVKTADGVAYVYVRSNAQLATGTYWITNTNSAMAVGKYDFDEYGLIQTQMNGIYLENGGLFFYENNQIKYNAGLIQYTGTSSEGVEYNSDWIYVRSNGQLATGTYWITNTNGAMASGKYEFDTDGKMIVTEIEDGIYTENGKLYYYKNGVKQVGTGLVAYGNSYIYVKTSGELATGEYYVTNTGDTGMSQGKYTFGDDGIMIQ